MKVHNVFIQNVSWTIAETDRDVGVNENSLGTFSSEEYWRAQERNFGKLSWRTMPENHHLAEITCLKISGTISYYLLYGKILTKLVDRKILAKHVIMPYNSISMSLSSSLRFLFELAFEVTSNSLSASLSAHFGLTFEFSELTLIALSSSIRFIFELTIESMSVSLRTCFRFDWKPLRIHFDFTLNSLRRHFQIDFGFASTSPSKSLRCNFRIPFGVTSTSL